MYFSRLLLNARAKTVRRDLASPYEMHSTLCRLFAEPDETPPRFLWRLEDARQPYLLVQSERQPNWDALQEDYLEQAETKPLQHFDALTAGRVLHFHLKANPTVKRNGKREGLKTLEEQLNWIHQQGERNGFQVLGALVLESQREQYRKRQGGTITLQSVTFQGHLKITHPEPFKDALQNGLGHGKGFGFGLLSIRRA